MSADTITFNRDDFEAFVRGVHRGLEVALVHLDNQNYGSARSWVEAAMRNLPPIVEPYGYIEYRGWPKPKEEGVEIGY